METRPQNILTGIPFDPGILFLIVIVNFVVQPQYLPLRRVKVDSNDKTWITPEIKDLISKRQAALAVGNGQRLDSTGTKLMPFVRKRGPLIT